MVLYPEMKGSYSIKYVLSALVPELSYDGLPIKEGGAASNTFLSMVNGTFEGDLEETKRQYVNGGFQFNTSKITTNDGVRAVRAF